MRKEKIHSITGTCCNEGGELTDELSIARRHKHVKDIEVIHLKIEGLDAKHNPDRKAVIVRFQ